MKFHDALKVYKALADESRLRLLRIFFYGEFHVNELIEIFGMGQSRVSRHLRIMHQAGVLKTKREGAHIFYGLNPEAAPFLQETLNALEQNVEKLAPDELAVQKYIAERKLLSTKFFDEVAARWDNLKKQYINNDLYIDEIQNLVNTQKTVLELGCGTGSLLISVAQKGKNYLGIDMSQEMIRIASGKTSAIVDTNIEFRLGDIENVSLPDNSCSTVIISMVLHHLLTPETTLQEAYRLLSPNGVLIIHDFVKHDIESYREIYNHRWLGFTDKDIESWLKKCGFGRWEFKHDNGDYHKMFICRSHKC